jgi:uncharacterized protein
MVISDALLARIRSEFAIEWDGLHGMSHWLRVHENGLWLAERTGASLVVVELFAFFHDSKRRSNGRDPEHGPRAAEFVRSLRDQLIVLPDDDFEHLVFACAYHTDGLIEADATVQTCWDADRLDLGRVGIRPKANYLCTAAARDPQAIEWAWARSRGQGGL